MRMSLAVAINDYHWLNDFGGGYFSTFLWGNRTYDCSCTSRMLALSQQAPNHWEPPSTSTATSPTSSTSTPMSNAKSFSEAAAAIISGFHRPPPLPMLDQKIATSPRPPSMSTPPIPPADPVAAVESREGTHGQGICWNCRKPSEDRGGISISVDEEGVLTRSDISVRFESPLFLSSVYVGS